MAPVPRFLIQRLDLLSIFDIVAGLLTLTALFTLVVQGLTLPLVVKRFAHQAPKAEAK